MFRSVGMNVNNPHFLIMQGRIGKVLNMTPKEILAMVEEAVGVRIYECRKTTCLRLIEKKDIKMKEISAVLHCFLSSGYTVFCFRFWMTISGQ